MSSRPEATGREDIDKTDKSEAAQSGDTIKILSDFTIEASKTAVADRIVIDKPVTIDFGEYTMTVPGELEPTGKWSALYIDANTTIEATTGGINCVDKEDPADKVGVYTFTVRSNAKLTINGGIYYGGDTVVQATQGAAEINGGFFDFTPYEEPYGSKFVLNCIDAAHNNGVASIVVKGGSFKNFDPRDIQSEPTQPLSIVADGYCVTTSTSNVDTIYTVAPAVAQIGEVKYTSLRAALDSIPANNESDVTIKLLADIQLPWSNGEFSLDVDKDHVIIDGQKSETENYTISPDGSASWDQYKVGGAKQKYGQYNLIQVTGDNVTVQNVTVDGGSEYRGVRRRAAP